MIKRFLISLIILLIISLAFCYNSVLAVAEMQLSANFENSTITSGSEVVINISISKLDGLNGGTNAFIFSLGFDTDDFEFVKIEGQNNWNSPTYNEAKIKEGTAKFATTRANFTTETGSIAKLILKAKKNFDLNNKPNVEIYDISFAGKSNNTTQKVVANNVTVSLNSNQGNINNGDLNSNGQGNGSSLNNNISNKRLPDAGKRTYIYILLFGILTISSYFIYKKSFEGI